MAQLLRFDSGDRSIPVSAHLAAPRGSTVGRRPAILLLHGSGGNVDFWSGQLASVLKASNLHLYAPHYFASTGTTRADFGLITDGIHVPRWLHTIEDALTFVASQPEVDPARIVVAGISLGAFLGLALGAQLSAAQEVGAAARIRALVDVSGGLVPPYDALATRRFPPTLILHGEADSVVPVSFATALTKHLEALGTPHQVEIFAGEGHWFSPAAWPKLLFTLATFLHPLLG